MSSVSSAVPRPATLPEPKGFDAFLAIAIVAVIAACARALFFTPIDAMLGAAQKILNLWPSYWNKKAIASCARNRAALAYRRQARSILIFMIAPMTLRPSLKRTAMVRRSWLAMRSAIAFHVCWPPYVPTL